MLSPEGIALSFARHRGPVPLAQRELTFHKLDRPINEQFDCGEKPQNDFLLHSAWNDQREKYSATYLAYDGGMLAGYVSLANDSIELTRDERPASAVYATIPALKIVQMGVDQRFQKRGVGEQLLDFGILHARNQSRVAGCRYVILDALPQRLSYYAKRGFVVNDSVYAKKIKRSKGKDPDSVTVSMRFDLREPGEAAVEDYHIALAGASTFTSRLARAAGCAIEWVRSWFRR